MNWQKIYSVMLDLIVPLGKILRISEKLTPFEHWSRVLFVYIPRTFFVYWLFTFIPIFGTLLYGLVAIPLSAAMHIKSLQVSRQKHAQIYLLYFVVILIGFGGIWNFIGHTFLADHVATLIGWETGSPFQTELAFYTLGTSFAALLAIWFREKIVVAVVVSKSVFLYGAAYVHIRDFFIHSNTNPLNLGIVLVGDIIYPSILLFLLHKVYYKKLFD